MSKITIIGYGSFGTALSVLLASKGHEVMVSARNTAHLEKCAEERQNGKYLPGIKIPSSIRFCTDSQSKKEAAESSEMFVFAVPSQHFGETLRAWAGDIRLSDPAGQKIIVNVAKGIELSGLRRLSEVAEDIIPGIRYVVLSGPSHAEEVGAFLPTTVAAASADHEAALTVQKTFMTDRFRVYTNEDMAGVELGGALKNIMALAAGISDGLGFGDNAKAALMTRGIAEITRLGTALGAKQETFAGLTGIGDLIVTCTSMHSRNRRCGILIGQGVSPEEAVKEVGMVVEGIYACEAACRLAGQYKVEMPITFGLKACLDGRITPMEVIDSLMKRSPKTENC